MEAGIANEFKKRYGAAEELVAQGKTVGDAATLFRDGRFLYYLGTKERFHHKPILESLELALYSMKEHAMKKQLREISMPDIGCGLDKLW